MIQNVLLISAICVYSSPKEPPPPPVEPAWNTVKSEVKHLSGSNFTQVTTEKDVTLVMFYAPWCGHCKKAKPEYQVNRQILHSVRELSNRICMSPTPDKNEPKDFLLAKNPIFLHNCLVWYMFSVFAVWISSGSQMPDMVCEASDQTVQMCRLLSLWWVHKACFCIECFTYFMLRIFQILSVYIVRLFSDYLIRCTQIFTHTEIEFWGQFHKGMYNFNAW